MNMSFGVAASPASGEIGGSDPPPASSTPNAPSAPVPPAPFSLPSASFTYQAPPTNLIPPARPHSAPSATFPYPPRFVYPNPPPGVPSSVMPPSASPAPPFSMQPGFTFQGPSGNPLPSSGLAGQSMLGMPNLQSGGVGQSLGVRPLPPTGLQTSASAVAQAGPSPPPLQVSGAPMPAGMQGSTPAAEPSANQGTPSMAMSIGAVTSTEATPVTPPGGFAVAAGTQPRPIVPPATVGPPVTGLPGQVQISTLPPPMGGVAAARTGIAIPPSTAVPFSPLRPAFATNTVAAPAIVPPGDFRTQLVFLPRDQRRA